MCVCVCVCVCVRACVCVCAKGMFPAKIGTINDRSGKDLTEVEEIEKRWQEYTEQAQKKVLMTGITMKV